MQMEDSRVHFNSLLWQMRAMFMPTSIRRLPKQDLHAACALHRGDDHEQLDQHEESEKPEKAPTRKTVSLFRPFNNQRIATEDEASLLQQQRSIGSPRPHVFANVEATVLRCDTERATRQKGWRTPRNQPRGANFAPSLPRSTQESLPC